MTCYLSPQKVTRPFLTRLFSKVKFISMIPWTEHPAASYSVSEAIPWLGKTSSADLARVQKLSKTVTT